ncbi:MAG: molybdopterin oxidoreductase family protein, partial [Candidatus Promineifilaceae bacterium]
MPRQNEQVNEIWICDKGRYGHHHARTGDRLTTPLIRRNGALVEATWDEALDLVARRVRLFPSAQIAGVAGDHLSNEDLFLFQALMRDVIGTPHVDVYPRAPGAELVARYGIGADSDWTRLDQNSAILVVAGDVEEQAPIWFLRLRAAVQRGAKLIVINGRETKLDRYATHRLRIRYGSAPHLLLGLTKLVLRDDLLVDGIKTLRQNLSSIGPASTQRLTGIATQDLQAVAAALTQAGDAIVVFGSEGLNEYGAQALAQAAANLLLATAHVGRANSGLLPLWPH